MTEREMLQDAYEDALFALLMYDMVHPEVDVEELMERVKTDPAADPPEGAYERSMAMLDRLCAQRHRKRVGRSVRRAATKIMMAAVLIGVLLTTAFAVSEDFRVNTLNLLIEISDVSARLTLNGESSAVPDRNGTSDAGSDSSAAENTLSADGDETSGVVLMGYQFPEVPEGFEVEFEGDDGQTAWIQYKNGNGDVIYFAIKNADGISHLIDTEKAEKIENISIDGYEGVLVEKNGMISVAWADVEQSRFIEVICKGISCDEVLAMVKASRVEFD